jgi:hypothetical protein
MDPRDALAQLWQQIESLPPELQYDRLIRFFAEVAKDVTAADLEILRHHFRHAGDGRREATGEVDRGPAGTAPASAGRRSRFPE